MKQQLLFLPEYLGAHLTLTLIALLLGSLISLPLGILASRISWLERPVMAIASIIQTIPGLALLAVMVPLLAALNLQSIGATPALIGITLYSILPILRNTVTGLAGVDPALQEAARGVGMTGRQRLFRVELPLAAPVIVAGLRTSTVWVVGIATLSTPVGATSLGNYIFSGLQTRNLNAVLVGCLASAGLAILLDGLIRLLETGIRERRRTLVGIVVAVFLSLYGFVGGRALLSWAQQEGKPLRIASKPFTEQYILSEIIAQKIHRETQLPTRALQSLGSTVAFDALEAGDIDAYVDYSGTLWANLLKRQDVPESREAAIEAVSTALHEKHGIQLAAVLGFENAYALALRRQQAEELGVRTISDLARHAPELGFGGDYEFFDRVEWKALEQVYGLRPREQRKMDPGLMYQACAQGQVDVISAYSTDGRILAFDLVVLEDDRGAIPPYDAVLLVRKGLFREYPDVGAALKALEGTIDAKTMRQLNLKVDRDKQSPATVAQAFLEGL